MVPNRWYSLGKTPISKIDVAVKFESFGQLVCLSEPILQHNKTSDLLFCLENHTVTFGAAP
eukprot:m.169408 g.169408  ORF g.169408 m.169408 type:complete len:61 (-) comp14777_c0_seq3:4220-4402(-)